MLALGNPEREQELVTFLMKQFSYAAGNRGIWEIHWQEVAQRVLPHYVDSFYTSQNTVPGAKRQQEQYDVTANNALLKFAAAMESMLTPASSQWHQIRPMDPNLLKIQRARLFYERVTDVMFHFRYSPFSGFQANRHETYMSIGAFGTGAEYIDEFRDPTRPEQKGLRYRHVPLGELYPMTNHQGQVDKVFRKFRMSLRQIQQKWPDKMPEGFMSRLKDKPEEEHFVIHFVHPNLDFMPGRLDVKGKRLASHYVLMETQTPLHEGGYRCMPYIVPRYMTGPGEIYGRGPAMNVLAGIKVLNESKRLSLKAWHRAVAPPLLAHDDGIMDGLSVTPDAVNYGAVSADGRVLVHALQTGQPEIAKEFMQDERMAINDAFLVTLFQILVETPQMTATEVLERAREKGALLSPTMGRFQAEGIGPEIEREFDLLMYQGLIPPPPPEVIEAGAGYKIEYDAPLNRAMRAEKAAGGMRTFQWAAEIAAQTQDPSVLDVFDTDSMVPELADINGMPLRWLRSPDAIAQIRQSRNADKQAQQITQALPGMAAVAKAAAPQGTSPNPGQPG